MTKKYPTIPILTIILGIVCLVLILSAYIILWDAPNRVKEKFGDPVTSLSFWQRTRYTLILIQKGKYLTDMPISMAEGQRFSISPDESIQSVAGRLKEDGLIQDEEAFITYLLYSGGDVKIKAGWFLFTPSSTALGIAEVIQDPALQEIQFPILKGWRIEEIAENLPTSGLSISPAEFLQISQIRPDGFTFSADMPVPGNPEYPYPIEGFLLPDTYQLSRETSVFSLITTVLQNFDTKVTPEIRTKINEQGLTLYEGVILASIIEKEAFLEEEKPTIASVYLNRIHKGMKLEADPTIQYALGFQSERGGWWSAPLWEDDLLVNSKFNTYQSAGLPPGPISNPDLASIKAVAYPAQTSYLFFRVACDESHSHQFSETFEQHLKNGCP